MIAFNYETTTSEHLIIIGYEDETHITVNTISNAVILCNGRGEELSRQLEYKTLEEAISSGQAILNFKLNG